MGTWIHRHSLHAFLRHLLEVGVSWPFFHVLGSHRELTNNDLCRGWFGSLAGDSISIVSRLPLSAR